MILAGDVGGTKTVLALYERGPSGLQRRDEQVFASREHRSLEELVQRFLAERAGTQLEAAAFGVAGPVVGGAVAATNLAWVVEEAALRDACGARPVLLLNDLEATAYGVLLLEPRERAVLQAGAAPARQGNAAVIAAGTGLGEAFLVWDGSRHLAVASEGGHADFAPRSEEEIELLRFLRGELGGRVSSERVVSGPGLRAVYRFLRGRAEKPEPEWLARELEAGDPGAVVARAALDGRDPVCARSLELFASLYGAEAGNMALRCMAVRVYVAGGIAPKILPALQSGAFVSAFADKGRFRKPLESVEIVVSLDPRVPLRGAAQQAQQLLTTPGASAL